MTRYDVDYDEDDDNGVHLEPIPSTATGSVSSLRVSRNCVSVAFIAESPPAQGQ